MKLIAFHKLGENRGSPRVWLESQRLATLGFAVGSSFVVEPRTRGVRLRINELGTHRVAKRRAAGGVRPIIDVANRALLASLAPFPEIRIEAIAGLIDIRPSARAFAIQRRLLARPPFRTLEIFAGGGTLSAAIASHHDFRLVAGVEIEPRFADVWQSAHSQAVLIQADIRRIHPSEYPRHEVLVAAIPCTSHSLLGRAKKSLRGKPELGESGDLFLCISTLVASKLPLACVFENVPSFRSSLAGRTLTHHLRQLGYYIYETVLDPHKEWNEPQDRRRWLVIATLQPGFHLQAPMVPFKGDISAFVDPPNDRDRSDAERIAGEHRRAHSSSRATPGARPWFWILNYHSSVDPGADRCAFLSQDQRWAIRRDNLRPSVTA
jgi:DNA (cytosine-5)-methyltransferase 1